MTEFSLRVFWETWDILKEASVFLLFGFLLAGVLAVLVPTKALSKLFGRGKIKSVLWGSAIGAPLPLCSCGVLPTAIGLRRQGATPGATVSFLIATPETGVDSISLTYALMDPIITVFRPLAAVVTAITAGLMTNFFGIPRVGDSSSDAHAHHHHDEHEDEHEHGHSHDITLTVDEPRQRLSPSAAVKQVYHYAFRQLLDETSYWLVLGIVLSGIVAALVPPTFFEQYFNNEALSMLVMLAIGIPIYTCASASTPLAAALVLKGLNPGAALVFLLSGPATNLGSIVVLLKFLGARIVAVYLASIVVVTLAAGFALNWVYRYWQIDPRAMIGRSTAGLPGWLKVAGALLFIALLVPSLRRAHLPAEWIWLRERFARLSGLRIDAKRFGIVTLCGAAVLYVSSGFFSVQPGMVAVKSRFGAIVDSDLPPGLHLRWPWPIESHYIVPRENIARLEFGGKTSVAPVNLGPLPQVHGRVPTAGPISVNQTWYRKESAPEDDGFLLTGDGNLIRVKSAVQYRIKDTLAFVSNPAEPELLVRSVLLTALSSTVSTISIDSLYTFAREEVEKKVRTAAQRILDDVHSGVDITDFRLLYVHAPDEVHDAFRDVASAQEDKQRTINRARLFAVEAVNQAKGEAAAMVEQALAFKEQRVLRAQGDAQNFILIRNAYRRAPELTTTRMQLETMEGVLPGLQKFVRPGASEMKSLDLWLLQPEGLNQKK